MCENWKNELQYITLINFQQLIYTSKRCVHSNTPQNNREGLLIQKSSRLEKQNSGRHTFQCPC